MNVLEMVEAQLKEKGADGLCNPDHECGCGLDDLMPCNEPMPHGCIAARKGKVTAEMVEQGEVEEGDDAYFPMKETPDDIRPR